MDVIDKYLSLSTLEERNEYFDTLNDDDADDVGQFRYDIVTAKIYEPKLYEVFKPINININNIFDTIYKWDKKLVLLDSYKNVIILLYMHDQKIIIFKIDDEFIYFNGNFLKFKHWSELWYNLNIELQNELLIRNGFSDLVFTED